MVTAAPPATEAVLEALRQAVPDTHPLAPDDPWAALADPSAAVVTAPASVEETSAAMATAHRLGAKVLVSGAGTKILQGAAPEPFQVVLCTRNLGQLIEHQPTDLTCVVQAGMPLSELQRRLGEQGQRVAFDPPWAGRATVGGVVATNGAGPRRLLYGAPRDLVIGMRCVQPDGRVSKSGGKVVKNVTGYDLNKLYTGSWGTLGVIVEVNLKVIPRPEAQRLALLAFDSAADAYAAAIAVNRSSLYPAALEVLNEPARRLLLPWSDGGAAAYLAAAFEGAEAGMARQVALATEMGRARGGRPLMPLEGPAVTAFWDRLSDLADAVAPAGRRLGLKAAVLPTGLPAVDAAVADVALGGAERPVVLAHAGSGILYALWPAGEEDGAAAAGVVQRARAVAAERGGSLVVEWAPAALKGRFDVWGPQRPEVRLMRSLKAALDPQGVMARGRFVGGL